jgi:uncharacterized protein (TIGR00251 family)
MSKITVRVTPRSAKPGIGEWKLDPDGRSYLEVRVAAAPADGKANAEVVRLLAKWLGLPKSSVTLVSGATARIKRLEIATSDEALRTALHR